MVAPLRGHADQRKLRCGEELLHELVTHLAVGAAMAGIVKLNAHQRLHRTRLTEQEVYVLLSDAVFCRAVLMGARNEEDVREADFGADEGLGSHDRCEDVVERHLCWREEVITHSVWE
jgi:hypothetical protein